MPVSNTPHRSSWACLVVCRRLVFRAPDVRRLARLLAAGGLVCAGPLLAGCRSQPLAPGAQVAVVAGQRSNSSVIEESPQLDGLISGLLAQRAQVSVIVPDGEPSVRQAFSLSVSAPNSLYRQREQAAVQQLLTQSILNAKALSPQADLLGAIALGARAVVGGPGARRVVIVDSGLQTVAPLEFQLGLLGERPSTVVAFLREQGELPDLRGTRVQWLGLGDVRAPQQQLTIAAYRQLRSIWLAILRASGAASVSIDPAPLPTATDPPALPWVTPVPIRQPGALQRSIVVALDPSSVDFVPNESTYLDPGRAQTILAALARQILAGPYRHVTLIGTTALPPGIELSSARATQVERTLGEDGVPTGWMRVRGLGCCSWPGFVPDRNPDGSLNNAAAERDRLVIVTATS